MAAPAPKIDISSLEINVNDLEYMVLNTMVEEKLDTYSAIANHLGETADVVYSALKAMAAPSRNIVTVVNDKPKRYYINDGSPIKQPKLDRQIRTERPPTPEDKLDYTKITELAANGMTAASIAKELGIQPREFEVMASQVGPLGIKIRAALVAGEGIYREKKTSRKPKAVIPKPDQTETNEQIAEPEAATSPTASGDITTELLEPLKVEWPLKLHQIELADEPTAKTQCTRTVVELQNGGSVSIEAAVDLFQASKMDRDFVDAIIELVQLYEQRKVVVSQ